MSSGLATRWALPILIGAAFAALVWTVTLRAFPFALMHLAMARIGGEMPANTFRHAPPATPEQQPIVRPSPDLLYSSCVFDVSEGPVSVYVPAISGHYWSVSVFDARTDTVIVRGERHTGGAPVRLLLDRGAETDAAGRLQNAAAAGFEPVALGYARGIVLVRILVPDPDDLAAVDALRRQADCRPV